MALEAAADIRVEVVEEALEVHRETADLLDVAPTICAETAQCAGDHTAIAQWTANTTTDHIQIEWGTPSLQNKQWNPSW